jgi:ABC-type methionine transport system ATPase subunit
MAPPPMVRLIGVSKQFDGKRRVTALEGIDLSVDRGEMLAIVGQSGSGM